MIEKSLKEKNRENEGKTYLKDLFSINMAKSQLYETIISTKYLNELDSLEKSQKSPNINAAPIGVLCKNSTQIVLYLYEGTHTLQNIKQGTNFIVNITQDPLLFTKSTLGDLSEDYFEYYKELPYLKDTDAFFVCSTEEIKDITKKNELGSSKMSIVTAKVEEVVQINSPVIPINRGIYAVIESLIHYTRLDLADNKTKNSYWDRIKEMNRVARKVGSPQEKEALSEIIKEIKSNFKDLIN